MKKAIITGASTGLGLEVGRQLVEKGVSVVNVSRKESPFTDITVDLGNKEDVKRAIDTISSDHADFDLLILNAGIMPRAAMGKVDFDIDNLFAINITGSIRLVDGLIDLIKKNSADIVIVGSTASFNPSPDNSVYVASKHAVAGFVKSLQDELKDDPVRVIGFHPGGFNSNLRDGVMHDDFMDPKDLAKILIQSLELPKRIEVSEIILKRNKGI